jgi:hypothetical protein
VDQYRPLVADHLLTLITGIFVLTGDLTAFTNTFGANEQVTLTYVPTGGGSGYLEVFDANTHADLGAMASHWNSFGEYDSVTSSSDGRLSVAIDASAATTPEPSTAGFLALGIGALAFARKRLRA